MDKDYLILKRASASRPSGQWSDDDYDVIADSVAVGRIMKAAASPVGSPCMWTYGFNPLERRPKHGYEATREAAMAAFALCFMPTARGSRICLDWPRRTENF